MLSSPWIRTLSPAHPAQTMRLFLFHHAGGTASAYRDWTSRLPDTVSLHAIQLPGREERYREAPQWRMASVVAEIRNAILPLSDLPFRFFGHSFGSKVAYATCRALLANGDRLPETLLVSGCRAPHLPDPAPLHNLSDQALLDALARFEGTNPAVLAEPELLRCFLPMLRADFTMDETWKPRPPVALPLPIHAFCGKEDPEASIAEMEAWKGYTSTGFRLDVFKGHHFFYRKNAAFFSTLSAMLSHTEEAGAKFTAAVS